MFNTGDQVRIVGLTGRGDLNDRQGKVCAFDPSRDRYHIDIQTEVVALKEGNIQLAMRGPPPREVPRVPIRIDWSLVAISVIIGTVLKYQIQYVAMAITAIIILSLGAPQLFLRTPIVVDYYGHYSRSLRRIEEQLQSVFGFSIKVAIVLSVVALLMLLYTLSESEYGSRFEDYYDDFSYSPRMQGVSIISVMILGGFLYRMDIPNNGLAAFRNLSFWEIMWLVNILQELAGGRRRGIFGGGMRRRRW